MATKRPSECPPEATNTPGVWDVDRPGRPNPFGVQWRERRWCEVKKVELLEKCTEFFSSAADRDRRRAEIFANKRAGRANDFTREEAQEWRAFLAAAGGVPWRTILAGFLHWQQQTGARPSNTTVENFRKRYIGDCTARVTRLEMSADNFRHRNSLLTDFAGSFGHVMLENCKTDEVAKWLGARGHASPFTWNSHRKHLFAFFNAAVTAELIHKNPIQSLERRRAFVDNRQRILTAQQTATLFETAMNDERFRVCLARLALEAFVGIRFSSAQRIGAGDIKLDDRGILLPAHQLKTGHESGQGHYIEGAPEQVWDWLGIAPEEGWTLTERRYEHLKSLLFVAASVPHPPNCFRKSFCTYDLNAHRNPGRTAFLLGHSNQKQLWKTYKGNATHAESVLYQAITPQTCAAIARGERPRGLNRRQKAPAPPGE